MGPACNKQLQYYKSENKSHDDPVVVVQLENCKSIIYLVIEFQVMAIM